MQVRGAAAQDTADERNRIVFLLPASTDPATRDTLRQALIAHFAGTEATLAFDEHPAPGDLRSQVAYAQQVAAERAALGVFWLDTDSEANWLLYLSEPTGKRVLVRRLELPAGDPAAGIEAVSVVTQHSSSALVQGETIGMRPVELEPPARPVPPVEPPAPEPAVRERHREPEPGPGAGFLIGYRGNAFARELSWQSGLSLGVVWMTGFGLFARGGGVFFQDVEVQDPLVTFQVSRIPMEIGLGWAHRSWPVTIAGELGAVLDVVRREALEGGEGSLPNPDDTRLVVALSPRARLEYALTGGFSVYISTGVDVALNNFAFVAEVDSVQRPLLRPHRVRALVDAGIALWP